MPKQLKVNLDFLLLKQQKSLTQLSEEVDITIANLSKLKRGKAKAIRFSTLIALCCALECQPGDLIELIDED